MRKSRTALIYGAILAASISIFLLIRFFGTSIIVPNSPVMPMTHQGAPTQPDMVLTHVLLALVVIIIAARVVGATFLKFNQPPVVGEMIAGILLGPSLLGHLSPTLFASLFPPTVLPFLSVISQIGVILYMFLVGVHLDTKRLRQHLETSIAISQASIIVPFLLGATLALWLYPLLSDGTVTFTKFALFMGVAMSVTAFPVLARILTDRQVHKSHIGTIALACAAAGDVMAWCLLAFVVSIARAKPGQMFLTVSLAVVFVVIVFFVVRPGLRWLARGRPSGRQTTSDTIVIVYIAILVAALATERIGIHAIFGAFLIGVIIPNNSRLAQDVSKKLEDSVVLLLLPAFFAFNGLRTEIGLVHGTRDWVACLLIIAVASAGKFGGSFVAARMTGLDWRQAASLGVLMNTRGLMELIVLNVGLDLGVISLKLFAMMVSMAVVTTVATTPLLQLVSNPVDFLPDEQR